MVFFGYKRNNTTLGLYSRMIDLKNENCSDYNRFYQSSLIFEVYRRGAGIYAYPKVSEGKKSLLKLKGRHAPTSISVTSAI